MYITELSEWQIYRKLKAYREFGIKSIPHKLKLCPSKKVMIITLKIKLLTYITRNILAGIFIKIDSLLVQGLLENKKCKLYLKLTFFHQQFF